MEEEKNLPAIKVYEDIKGLPVYEQSFIKSYISNGDVSQSVKDARKECKMPMPKDKNLIRTEGKMILSNPDVAKVIKTVRNANAEIVSSEIARTGVDISKRFDELSKSKNDRIIKAKNKVKMYDSLIAVETEPGIIMSLDRQQQTWIKILMKEEEADRKNLSMINDIIGTGKQKIITKVGSLNINLGNQTIKTNEETKKNLKIVEAQVEETIIEDYEDIND